MNMPNLEGQTMSKTKRVFQPGYAEFMDFCADARTSSGKDYFLGVPEEGTTEQRRFSMEVYTEALRRPLPEGMKTRNWYVTAEGREIPIRVYYPKPGEKLPTVLFIHGGGFVGGSLDSHNENTMGVAELANVNVVAIHYRRAPENPYPAAIDDCHRVLQWVRSEGSLLGLDETRIGLAGDSAGGHLATALTHRLKRVGEPQVKCQVLIYPVIEPDYTTESYLEGEDCPLLTTEDMRRIWGHYIGSNTSNDPELYPMRAPNFEGLPPALIINAQYDPLRDDGINYGKVLEEAGIPTEVRTVPGVTHAFIRSRFKVKVAKEEFDYICKWLSDQVRK